jgi:hypothetical protein
MLKVKHGGTNIILDATFIHIYYIQFDKRNVLAITILGVGKTVTELPPREVDAWTDAG